jgi:hypothetical protein
VPGGSFSDFAKQDWLLQASFVWQGIRKGIPTGFMQFVWIMAAGLLIYIVGAVILFFCYRH